MRRAARCAPWVGLATLVCSSPGWAWLRPLPNWPALIEESELVVVGRLAGEPVYVEHQRGPDDGRSWEFHARLAVDEVLRGACSDAEIQVVLHYGLWPSHHVRDGKRVTGGWDKRFPGQAIWDSGSSAVRLEPILEDAERPAVWFLAHYADRIGRAGRPTEQLGVRDPEQLRSVALLPLVRSLLRPDALDEQLTFLRDPNEDVRRECLRYFRQRREPRAFAAVAELLKDPALARDAVLACQACGGPASVSRLRVLLDDETSDLFPAAVYALVELDDRGALLRLVEVLREGRTPGSRGTAAWALGRLGDPRVIPDLLDALHRDDALPGSRGEELWVRARDALAQLTGCTLSANGDKASRWWQAAQSLSPDVWRHFEIARLIDSLPSTSLGPDGQEQAEARLRELTGWRQPGDRRYFWWPREYDPQEGHRRWRELLERQGWTDYQALPSQTDDELALVADMGDGWKGAEPLRIRYTLTNGSDRDLWLTKHCFERLRTVCANGNGGSRSMGEYNRPAGVTQEDFFRLPSGESRVVLGEPIAANRIDGCLAPPAGACPALVFDRKGTSVGLDAWVGEVWAEPVRFAPAEP